MSRTLFKPKRRQVLDPGLRILSIGNVAHSLQNSSDAKILSSPQHPVFFFLLGSVCSPPVRLADTDGGSIRALSQLVILREMMSRIQVDQELDDLPLVCDYFEVIGGTGSGAFISVLLGRLRLPIDKAIEEFVQLAMTAFMDRKGPGKEDAFKSTRLEEAIKAVLKRCGLPPDTKLNGKDKLNEPENCKVILCAVPAVNLHTVHLFRNYDSPLASSIDADVTIVESIRASMASPSIFKPIHIGPKGTRTGGPKDLGQEFIGGSLLCNNPTQELLKEAVNVYKGERRIACILNLGSGKPQILTLKEETQTLDNVVRMLEEIASDGESEAEKLIDRFENTGVYFRLSVDRGLETVGIAEWRELGKIEGHTQTYLNTSATTRLVDLCLKTLSNKIGLVSLTQLTKAASSVTHFRGLPPLTPYFVMRPEVWSKMTEALVVPLETEGAEEMQRIFILYGMGGTGKTQIALKFAKEYQTMFSYVFFLDGSSEDTIKAELQAAVRSLGAGLSQVSVEDALAWLARIKGAESTRLQPSGSVATRPDWLLIFDNVDDPSIDLTKFFPKSRHGYIIVTTRNRDLAQLAPSMHHELGPMTDEEAVGLLLKAAHRKIPQPITQKYEKIKEVISEGLIEEPIDDNPDRTIAIAIVKELGNLPVALVQAGSYSFRMHCFKKYLDLFRKNRSKLLKDQATAQLDQYNRSVWTTIETSYDALSEAAKDFLHICSFFHNANIPQEIFEIAARNFLYEKFKFDVSRYFSIKETAKKLSAALNDPNEGGWSDIHFHDTVHQLVIFSLVSIVHSPNNRPFFTFHPLVHSWARDYLSREKALEYKTMAVRILICATDSQYWLLHRHLMPHILELVEYGEFHPNDSAAFADILTEAGAYERGLELRRDVKRACHTWNGEAHISSVEASALLAAGYLRQGLWQKAVDIAKQVASFKRGLYGPDDRRTLTSERELGFALHQAGRWKEAESLQAEVLRKQKALLGDTDPETTQAAAELAHSYIQQGKWKESEDLAREVYRKRVKSLGKEHPDTVLASSNLALIYYETNRWKEAMELEEEVLRLREKVLGPEHPDTMDAMNNIAATYSQLDRWEEAERIEEKVYELRKMLFGVSHPDTVSAANNLAVTYREIGKLEKAQELLENAYKSRCDALGKDHPDVLHPLANLTLTYGLQGRLEEAKKLAINAEKMLLDNVNETNHPVFKKTLRKVQAILETDMEAKAASS